MQFPVGERPHPQVGTFVISFPSQFLCVCG
jgi:hypothetical protein